MAGSQVAASLTIRRASRRDFQRHRPLGLILNGKFPEPFLNENRVIDLPKFDSFRAIKSYPNRSCEVIQRDAETLVGVSVARPGSSILTVGTTDIPGPKPYCSICVRSSKTTFTGTRCTTFT